MYQSQHYRIRPFYLPLRRRRDFALRRGFCLPIRRHIAKNGLLMNYIFLQYNIRYKERLSCPYAQLKTTPIKRIDSGGIAPPFMTGVLDGGGWSASLSGRFATGKRAPDAHWIGG
jgi:hypothetical protein